MMKFRKNQNKEKQIPKEKKPRVYYKVNPHKKVVIALWVLLGLSFLYPVYEYLYHVILKYPENICMLCMPMVMHKNPSDKSIYHWDFYALLGF